MGIRREDPFCEARACSQIHTGNDQQHDHAGGEIMNELYLDVAKYLIGLKKEAKKIENGKITITLSIQNGEPVSCEQAIITEVMAKKEGRV